MQIEVEKVRHEQKSVVHNLSQFYLYEFSNYMPDIKLTDEARYAGFSDRGQLSTIAHATEQGATYGGIQ